MESGIETAMMSVLRQLPRKTRIMNPVKAGGDQRLTDHADDRRFYEDRLVRKRSNFQCRRQTGGNRGQQGFDAGDDIERRGVAGLQNNHQRRALAIHADNVGLRRKSIADMGYVVNIDRGGAGLFDGDIVQVRDR